MIAQIDKDLKKAIKTQNTVAKHTLRSLINALDNFARDLHYYRTDLSPEQVIQVIRKQYKQRQDSVAAFADSGRLDLIAKEEEEMSILKDYLPVDLTDAQLQEIVYRAISTASATSKADMGKVIKIVVEKAAGKADGKRISQEVLRQLTF